MDARTLSYRKVHDSTFTELCRFWRTQLAWYAQGSASSEKKSES